LSSRTSERDVPLKGTADSSTPTAMMRRHETAPTAVVALPNDIEFSGQRKRVRCNEGSGGSPNVRARFLHAPRRHRLPPEVAWLGNYRPALGTVK
jgi:hypothetical protein